MNRRRIPDEFALIAQYFAPLAAGQPGAFGLTDDAAVLDLAPGRQLVATADALVAGVHFREADPPDLVARKLLRVNLSDLAAMGARPIGYLLCLMLPREVDAGWLDGFAAGLARDQEIFAVSLAGGDTVATSGPLTLTLTALGEVESGKALRRSGARVGDIVYVSGTIGDGALGLAALEGDLANVSDEQRRFLADRYRLPEPRLALGLALQPHAHAAADVSDGLIADLGHIVAASGTGAVVEAAGVPLSEAAATALAADPELLAIVLTGGDDYELVFTAPETAAGAIAETAAFLDLPLTAVGRIVAGEGVSAIDADGRRIALESAGFSHF